MRSRSVSLPGDRLAVVGRNGEGKTTLLRIIAGQLAADGGRVSLPKGARIALHDQRPPLEVAGRTLEEYVAEGMADAIAAEAELAELEARMAAGRRGAPGSCGLRARARELWSAPAATSGAAWMTRVTRGLGIPDARLADPLTVFSGGELTRASLARALVARPDVLLLDEPTNHLDVQSTEWLEDAIAEMGCAVVLVSHDRYFLESIATAVLELDRGRSRAVAVRVLAVPQGARARGSRSRPRRPSGPPPRSPASSDSSSAGAPARARARPSRAQAACIASPGPRSTAPPRPWRSASRRSPRAAASCSRHTG